MEKGSGARNRHYKRYVAIPIPMSLYPMSLYPKFIVVNPILNSHGTGLLVGHVVAGSCA